MSLVLANAFLLFMVLAEQAFVYFVKKKKIAWREVIFNLNSGHILMWILRGGEVAAFHFVSTYWSLHLLDSWSYVAVWLFAFFSWDMCFYWLHRLHHKLSILWAVHVVHHEGEHYDLSLGIRNSWYSSLTSFPFFIGLAIIGVPVEIFIATSSIHYIVQFYNHNSIVKKSGFLEKIMITPSHHRVHHGKNPQYIDKNFGGTLVIWDKLFGTFQPELSTVPVKFGVEGYVKNYDIFWANNLPFMRLFGIKIPTERKLYMKYIVPESLIKYGGILLFGLLLYYISKEQTSTIDYKMGLFVITFIGTVANGGISENKRWGLMLWFVDFVVLSPIYIAYFHIYSPVLLSVLALLFVHSFFAIFKVVRVPVG